MRHFFGDKPLKSYRLWLLIGFLSYTLCGFLLIPYVLKTQLIKFVDGTLQQKASLEQVEFNPFLLRLRLQNLQLTTPEQAPLLGFDEFVIDFDTFGIFKRAWQFSEISLTGMDINAEIDNAGELNLNRLIPPASDKTDTAVDDNESTALPRLILQNIAIHQGHVHYSQLNRAEPFNIDLSPLNFGLARFSTLPEDGGNYHFAAQFSDTETLAFTGKLQLEPLAVAGRITLDNIALNRGGDYLRELLLFTVNAGTLSISSDFSLDNSGPAQSLALQANNINIAVEQLQLDTLAPVEPLLKLSRISLNNASFTWPEQQMIAESLVVDNGFANSWLTRDKVFNYSQLIKSTDTPASTNTAPANEPAATNPLQLRLEQIQLKELLLSFDDRSLREPAPQKAEIVELTLKPFTLEQDAKFDLQAELKINATGKTLVSGKVGAMPPMAALAIKLQEVPLPPINSYLHDTIQLNLTKGKVDADLQLDYQTSNSQSLSLRGDIAIKQLDTFDLADQESWINWQNLAIDDLHLQLEPASLNIANIELTKPYFDAIVFENGETRLFRMLVPATEQPAKSDDSQNTEASSVPITIAKFKLIDGSMDYKDFNLPLNFATQIHSLHGQAVDISTISSTPTQLVLDGKIDQHGTAKITAASQLSSPQAFSEIKLDLANVDITSASSYSGKFAGYAIDAGTLGLNLDYRIQQGQMRGDNHMLLEHLTLGDTVDSPDAVSLPLKLAVALMKDVNGNIDIDLPVEGDLNNPEVRIGGLVWKAFGNLLVKVVASPFKMLGGLFDNGDEGDFEHTLFTPGASELAASEQQKLGKLAQALQQKPALALIVSACYQPESDSLALQTQQFNQAYQVLSGNGNKNSGIPTPSPINYQSAVLEKMYRAAFSTEKLALLKVESEQVAPQQTGDGQHPDAGRPQTKRLDSLLLQELVSKQALTPEQLASLAKQRAEAVFNYLTGNNEGAVALDSTRLQIAKDPVILPADAEAITCPLTLSAL
ncbi:hypothetical protein A9Q88_03685 [Gammaproteobacteria bacterium 50_400_T64]|nr:hypothetical protein A9Q88_03685 [Gammaproteobacteria bacterium 50_400_T64]